MQDNKTRVGCSVDDCKFNYEKECDAPTIQVGCGGTARCCADTECDTFIKR